MMKATKAPKAVGYLRVSTADQATSGLGLEAQAAVIVATAAKLGLPLVTTFTDAGVSGGLSLEQRPALLAASVRSRRAMRCSSRSGTGSGAMCSTSR